MKIFGIELLVAADGSQAASTLLESIDAVHDALVADERVYSADIVADGADIYLLLGVLVPTDATADTPARYFDETLTSAFESAELDVTTLVVTPQAPAKELAFA